MREVDQDRVMTIVAEAIELPAAQRGRFVDSTCSGEPELRREVEELLACADSAAAAFDAAAESIVQPDPDRIGPYEIIEPVGEGGMAIVYKARQHHPVQRTVALKLVKLGMDTRQFIARFESERQALALMGHPNVARVYDAGSTDTGRPYFVMEYVAGEPLLEYCDGHQLDLRQRLALFIVVCEAVEHAHRRGIIHRDLKNTNVLVAEMDGRAVPKVIDFGVAKTIQQPLSDRALQTEAGQMIGTPEYMSPEQADCGLDVDTRADVYSLGVLLYELIAGVQPIASDVLRRGSYEQVQRVIRETEAPRPSTRLSTLGGADAADIAKRRNTALPTLIRDLRSELEWIPLKAMRKDREQRYRSAAELADDIRNYLDKRPLIAGPETAGYKFGKFLRRHKAGMAASVAMVLLLIGGIFATSWQAIRATNAEHAVRAALEKVQHANADTRAVNDFLTLDVLWAAEPTVTRGRELSVRQALDNAAADVGTRFKNRPRIEAAVRSTLAGAYRTLGQLDTALMHSQVAVDIVRRLGMAQDPEGLQIINDLGIILMERGDESRAEQIFRQTLEARRRVLGDAHPVTVESIGNLAAALLAQGKVSEAEPLAREDMRLRKPAGSTDIWITVPVARLAMVLQEQGKPGEAEALLRQALDQSIHIGGEDHPQSLQLRQRLARLLDRQGDYAQAEELYRRTLSDRRRVLGDDHPDTVESIDRLATLLVSRGKTEDAEPLAGEALERSRRLFGGDHRRTLAAINNLARAKLYRGQLEDAERLFREALESCRRVRGDESDQTLSISLNLALVLTRRGKLDEAEPLLRKTLAVQERVLGEDDAGTITSSNNLGGILFERKEFAQAEPLFRKALDARRRLLGPGHPETLGVLSNLGRALRAQSRHDDAEPLFAELYRLTATAQVPPRQAALFMSHWGPCLAQLGRYDEAEIPLKEALQRLRATDQTRGEHMQRVLSALADVCDLTNRPAEAAQWRAELHNLATTQPATAPR